MTSISIERTKTKSDIESLYYGDYFWCNGMLVRKLKCHPDISKCIPKGQSLVLIVSTGEIEFWHNNTEARPISILKIITD